jgi:hypothetical protein
LRSPFDFGFAYAQGERLPGGEALFRQAFVLSVRL